MTLLILSYLAGVLTILSPCILPVLPFVFSRADRPFHRAGLPLLGGMAITFAGLAGLATLGGDWVAEASSVGRTVALVLFGVFALTLLFPALAECLARPAVVLGNRLSAVAPGDGAMSSVLLGAATGLLWAPCAGPILGLVLTGAAINGASIGTTLALIAYGAGAATSLALALLAGGRVLAALKGALGTTQWVRRSLGLAVLGAVLAMATGLDADLLARASFIGTNTVEQRLIDQAGIGRTKAPAVRRQSLSRLPPPHATSPLLVRAAYGETTNLPVEGSLPGFAGAVEWINSPPLTAEELHGKVVLVNFWTFACINCRHVLPYVDAWADKYRDHGLVVIGVHTPELAFERNVASVRKEVSRLGVNHPVAIDNTYAIWNAFKNQYWPANYFVDAEGRIRYHHFGEEDYANSERVIQQLLEEAGNRDVPGGLVTPAS